MGGGCIFHLDSRKTTTCETGNGGGNFADVPSAGDRLDESGWMDDILITNLPDRPD